MFAKAKFNIWFNSEWRWLNGGNDIGVFEAWGVRNCDFLR